MNVGTNIKKRRTAYQDTFGSPQGETVLADLHEFCGADKTSFGDDPYLTAYNEGMRRVWLRINSFLNMTDEQILRVLKVREVDHE